MNRIHNLRLISRLAAAAAGMAAALVAFTAPPAFASPPPPGPTGTPALPVSLPCTPECSPLLDKHLLLQNGHWTGPLVYRVHTVVVGGMPGWQIALIATGAAFLAAALAITVDRLRPARGRSTIAAA
jgi:hypothetical protein